MLHCVSTLRNQGVEMSRSWQQPTGVTGKVSYRFGGKVGWGLQPSPDREAAGAAKPSLLLHQQGNGTLLGYERTPGKAGTALELAAHSSTTSQDAHSASLRRGLAEPTSIHHLHPAWQKTFIPRISGALSVGFKLQHFHAYFWTTHSPAQPGAAAFPAPLLEGLGGLCAVGELYMGLQDDSHLRACPRSQLSKKPERSDHTVCSATLQQSVEDGISGSAAI